MACPPEDCGGPWGYPEFLEAIQNPKHKQHEELLEWVGGEFDPEEFDLESGERGVAVNFSSSKKEKSCLLRFC